MAKVGGDNTEDDKTRLYRQPQTMVSVIVEWALIYQRSARVVASFITLWLVINLVYLFSMASILSTYDTTQ